MREFQDCKITYRLLRLYLERDFKIKYKVQPYDPELGMSEGFYYKVIFPLNKPDALTLTLPGSVGDSSTVYVRERHLEQLRNIANVTRHDIDAFLELVDSTESL